MENIYAMLNKNAQKKTMKQELSPEEFAKQMQERRERLYALADKQLQEVIASPDKYLQFLELMSRINYTVTNTLLVMAQYPQAVMVKESSYWNQKKLYIQSGQKGIEILKKSDEYEKDDGSIGISYNPRAVFDVSQINTKKKLYQEPKLNVENMIYGLTYNLPIPLQLTDHLNGTESVLYAPKEKIIYYGKDLSPNDLVHGLIREFCYAECDQQFRNYERELFQTLAESSAYILCSKYGVTVNNKEFAKEMTDYLSGLDKADAKKELTLVRDISKDVGERIDKGIYKLQQGKERKDEAR